MRILALSHSAVVPEYQQKFEYLANTFRHDVCLIIPKHWRESGNRAVSGFSRESGCLTVKALPCLFPNRLRRHFYLGLNQAARQFRPPLIYVEEEPQAEVTNQARKLAQRLGARLVFFTWENISQTYRGRKRAIEQAIYSQASGAVAGNAAGQEILHRNGFQRPSVVIPQYGVDLSLFRPQSVPELRARLGLTDSFVLGYVGRLMPEKNVGSVLSALKNLPTKIVFLVIGNGPERSTLERRVKDLDLQKRVVFISAVAYREMPKYLNVFNALVLPSLETLHWKEQFGRVLIEAMACGVPVIGSDSGEIPKVIGSAGIVFAKGDERKLSEAISLLFRNPDKRRQLSQVGRQRVKDNFTNEKIAQRLSVFFEQIIKSP